MGNLKQKATKRYNWYVPKTNYLVNIIVKINWNIYSDNPTTLYQYFSLFDVVIKQRVSDACKFTNFVKCVC